MNEEIKRRGRPPRSAPKAVEQLTVPAVAPVSKDSPVETSWALDRHPAIVQAINIDNWLSGLRNNYEWQ